MLKSRENLSIPSNISRAGPWIIWSIWKNRNSHLFEGCVEKAPDFLSKVYDEVNHWFLIKAIGKYEKLLILKGKRKFSSVGNHHQQIGSNAKLVLLGTRLKIKVEPLGFSGIVKEESYYMVEDLSLESTVVWMLDWKVGCGQLKVSKAYILIRLFL